MKTGKTEGQFQASQLQASHASVSGKPRLRPRRNAEHGQPGHAPARAPLPHAPRAPVYRITDWAAF